MSAQLAGFDVRFASNAFYLSPDPDKGEFEIKTDLVLDRGSEAMTFEVMPLVRAELHENSIHEVFLTSTDHDDARIGWIIPANALSSTEHDHAKNPHFLKFAFVTILEVLKSHQTIYASEIERRQSQGIFTERFGDLFHDNVCFLAISMVRLPNASPLEFLKPSLIGLGYLPYGASAPDSVRWQPQAVQVGKKIKVRSIVSGMENPDVPIKMMTVAAASGGSPVTQFFYLYQVVEFLMELVLRSSIHSIGSDIGKSIAAGKFQLLREHLEEFQSSMSEKTRLKLLMGRCTDSSKAIAALEEAAAEFLALVGVTPKPGISGLYQVRNFVIHQVRTMPDDAEELLQSVVYEFASFLSVLLATFSIDSSHVASVASADA